MALTVGLRRAWVVLSLLYVLAGTGLLLGHMYWHQTRAAELEEKVAAAPAVPAESNRTYGYRNPAEELKSLREEQRMTRIVGPLAIVGPPIALYLLGIALVWVVAGFRSPPAQV